MTEEARRAQIVAAAIEVIADLGYQKASFAKIAQAAGLSSTGMISYHFAGKDDLTRAVMAEVLRVAEADMAPRVAAQDSPSGRLRAYIESNVELLVRFPKHLPALIEVVGNLAAGTDDLGRSLDETLDLHVRLFEAGQQAGHFRPFDPRAMAVAMRGAIDAVVARSVREPGMDVTAYARELADIFDLATRTKE
ncbi:TetR/AcrR family transcriptional regulator [Kibdelosporangium lantanae]